MAKLSIIIPAFNEERGIGPTLDGMRVILRELDAEVIVVDDGSTDRTGAIAAERGARVIRHDSNLGYGAALKTGIRNATSDAICITDSDGTYPNQRIPELFRALDSYDMVVGARTGASVAIPLIRRPAKKVLNLLANVLTGRKIPDLNSGLRVFKRPLVERYLKILPSGFSFTTTITLAMLNDDYLVKFVPIDYYPRSSGRSKIRGFRDTYHFVMLILRVTMYFNPLKIFLPVATVLGIVTACCVFTDVHHTANLSDKTVILSLATMLVFLAGLLADVVARK